VSTDPVPRPGPGEFCVEVTHVSVDPALRGWMNDVRSYIPPIGIGEVMRAGAVGRVGAVRRADLRGGRRPGKRRGPGGTAATQAAPCVASWSSSQRLTGVPQRKPVSPPLEPITRWQGTNSAAALRAQALAAARIAVGRPQRAANSA
jgi:hypothetical protein